jgi:glycosyltransferase involved in cell wall biosynthesis
MSRQLRVFTWHIHGNYLYYLSRSQQTFYIPVSDPPRDGYWGRSLSFDWPDNVIAVPESEVASQEFDVILYQHERNWLSDQYEVLSETQRRLPRIYLEHDPPLSNPTNARHIVDDPNVLLVHVTPFNDLMWDSGRTPTRVIEHGVVVPDEVRYTGRLDRGIVVVNNLLSRGRRLGADVYLRAAAELPLDLVGMNSLGLAHGLGEVPPMQLAAFEAEYRFFFNPIRYTSLGLAVCEAMMLGMPIVGLATTEMATVVENDFSGFLDTRLDRLLEYMRFLIREPDEARRLGDGSRHHALSRFNIDRFVADWNEAFAHVTAGAARRSRAGAGKATA